MHANGGIIKGGVACVCAEWRVFVNYCAFLHSFVRFCAFLDSFVHFCAFFSYQNGLQKERKFAQNSAKMSKKRFYAIPPLVIPPFACHRAQQLFLFISRDTCSDSIAKLFRVCFFLFFNGVSHNYRAIRCKMGYRTGVPV